MNSNLAIKHYFLFPKILKLEFLKVRNDKVHFVDPLNCHVLFEWSFYRIPLEKNDVHVSLCNENSPEQTINFHIKVQNIW
jgi:hypothetical protein